MTNTVICVYDNFAQAHSAFQQLMASGFESREVRLRPADNTPQARMTALQSADLGATQDHPAGGTLRNFFRDLFSSGDTDETHADRYAEAVRRGSFVLTVDAGDEQQRDAAASIMEQFQPVDIDERATRWHASGWRGHDETASPLTDEELANERTLHGTGLASDTGRNATATTQQAPSQQPTTISVIAEELKVGKREVQRGGVRIIQRVTETPVQESINLRQEHVSVERHAVNQPATLDDLNGMKEGTIEMREMAEEAVVSKTARVVEEVVIGKDVSEQQTTINDTVRRNDVEIEQLGAGDNTASATHMIEEDFRHHWQSAYGQSSTERFEDYAPAYQYGASLARDQRFRDHNWETDESTIRQQWESTHPQNAWDKVKDAVHYGWNKVAH